MTSAKISDFLPPPPRAFGAIHATSLASSSFWQPLPPSSADVKFGWYQRRDVGRGLGGDQGGCDIGQERNLWWEGSDRGRLLLLSRGNRLMVGETQFEMLQNFRSPRYLFSKDVNVGWETSFPVPVAFTPVRLTWKQTAKVAAEY